jgi:hypothetical protein
MKAFCAATDEKPSAVTKEVMNDTTSWRKLVAGRNFTIATYQKLQAHLDKKWPDEDQPKNGL